MNDSEKSNRELTAEVEGLQSWLAALESGSVETTRPFLERFALEQPDRHSRLAQLLKERHKNNLVLVMMVNHGYMDLFLNWVRSCDEHGLEVRSWSLVFAVDTEAALLVQRAGFTTYQDDVSYGAQAAQAATRFGDGTFRRLMFQKTAIVEDVVQLGYDVLFQDVDLVWKKDPTEYLSKPAAQTFDVRFMYDGPNQHYKPLHANSGFFLLKNTEASRRFWHTVLINYHLMARFGSQQKIVNGVLLTHAARGLTFDILPEQEFANGHLFKPTDASRLPPNPYVIHCSWTANIADKIRKYKNANLWYLEDDTVVSEPGDF